MKIKDYWDHFYKQEQAPSNESDFARFTLNYINQHQLSNIELIDVACGNGRDTFFFANNHIKSTGIDLSMRPESIQPQFILGDILDLDYAKYDLFYLRFIVHALVESDFDILLDKIIRSGENKLIFIETRSSKGITNENKSETYFKSSVGEEHFRMLYSENYLTKKFQDKFEIILKDENNGFSIYKGEDPVCIRYILST